MRDSCLRQVHTCKFKLLLLVVPLGKGLEELVVNIERFPPVAQKAIERSRSLTSCSFWGPEGAEWISSLALKYKGAAFFLVTVQTPHLAARIWSKTKIFFPMVGVLRVGCHLLCNCITYYFWYKCFIVIINMYFQSYYTCLIKTKIFEKTLSVTLNLQDLYLPPFSQMTSYELFVVFSQDASLASFYLFSI